MKFAFSTVACPKWNFQTIAARAKEYGYDGVEIRGFLNEPVAPAADIFGSDLIAMKELFAQQGIKIACLSSAIAMSCDSHKDASLADDCRRFIDTAASLGCGLVKILDTRVKPGRNRSSVAMELGEWLAPLGDYAAGRNVGIVLENALSFRVAREMWLILDRLNQPSINCCWNVLNAALAGEAPAVSVPTLNSRIELAQVTDAKLTSQNATLTRLGDGDVQVRKLLTRLRGIGYHGWVSMHWDKVSMPTLAEPEDILPDSIKKLREWTTPPPRPEPKAPPKAAVKKEPVAKTLVAAVPTAPAPTEAR